MIYEDLDVTSFRLRHNILRNYNGVKKFNHMLETYILRNIRVEKVIIDILRNDNDLNKLNYMLEIDI